MYGHLSTRRAGLDIVKGSESNAGSPLTSQIPPFLAPQSSNTTINSPSLKSVSSPNILGSKMPVSHLNLISPKPSQSNFPLFRIGMPIVFKWAFNGTTLMFPPANLTVDVSLNLDPPNVWPVANVSGSTTSVLWDTAKANSSVLFVGFYTLNIYDPTTGRNGTVTSGHLAPYSGLRFGLYRGGPSISKTDGKDCASCRLSSSAPEKFWGFLQMQHTILIVIGVAIIEMFNL
ncbi:hypothetical protein BX616_002994 [Lobosporangium transversale]|uniref:DUF7137 domain-containing protein n=1 Tax=Lobosporangium transversale TaxID=64571 RepID=A0A1Y2GW52_9FUNG|nr:hypothetical protein BCR41DRAFT_393682 [Lobosporangium transversale]KAF9916727.1 hypothetical protein BX616_002994 [Lobosporangium transversale]ORZ26499.1 hypothetical protein BCR41DRAFT_393682 [Lobosporangium transversale]|eukprot:XP_021884264.1 hypothetical protein BCR41DRAFT_393682 [Lobosporangium transversale]